MRCPRCGHNDTRVVDSRLVREGDSIRRRRECESCAGRFTTFEHAELPLPTVLKQDGRREPWDREKIIRGLERACQKRPVTREQRMAVVDGIERELSSSLETEISAKRVGELVMQALRPIDGVAWVRFASVYLSFQDIGAFIEAVERHSKEEEETPP